MLISDLALAASGAQHETSRAVDDAIQKQLPTQRLTFNQSGAATMPVCTVQLSVLILRSDDPGVRTAKVRCSGPDWTLYVGFRVETQVAAPVVVHPVQAGQKIGPNDYEIRDVPAELVAGKPVPLSLLRQGGVTASLDLHPGAYISFNDATVPSVIRNGQHVRVTINDPGSGLTLTASAIAMENGGLGQMIDLENARTHRQFDAKIVRSLPATKGVFIVAPTG